MGKQQQNTLTPRRSVYNDLGLESNNISYDQFSKKFDESEEFRKSVYSDLGFQDQGVDYDKFYTIMGKPTEVPAPAAAPTSPTSVAPMQPTEPLNANQTDIQASQIPPLGDTLNPSSGNNQGGGVSVQPGWRVGEINGMQFQYDPTNPNSEAYNPLPEATALTPNQKAAKDLTFWENAKNASINAWERLKTFDDRLKLLSADAAENILGKDLAKAYYANEWLALGEGARDISQVRADALAELQRSENATLPTALFTESLANNDFGGVANAVVSSTINMAQSALLSATPQGVGMAIDMLGDGLYSYNKKKAEAKGVSIENLYKNGDSEFWTPMLINSLAVASERLGYKGMKNAMLNNLTGPAIKKLAVLGYELNKEGMTEWFQTGLSFYSDALAQGKSQSEAANAMWSGMFSDQGLESYLQGVAGAGAIAGAGRISGKLANKALKNTVFKKEQRLDDIKSDVLKTDDPQVKSVLLDEAANIAESINKDVDKDLSVIEKLPDNVKTEIQNINETIASAEKAIADPNISEETKKVLTDRIAEDQKQIDTLIKENQVETKPTETKVAPRDDKRLEELASRLTELNSIFDDPQYEENYSAKQRNKFSAEYNTLLDEYQPLYNATYLADNNQQSTEESNKVVPGLTQVGENIIESNPELKQFEDKWVKQEDGRIQVFETPYEGAKMLYDSKFVPPELPSQKNIDKSENKLKDLWNNIYRANRDGSILDLGFGMFPKTMKDIIDNGLSGRFFAHGMGKSGIGGSLNELLNLFDKGVDPNRGPGYLYTAPLEGSGEASSGIGAGSAYANGSFILITENPELSNINQVEGILVNDGLVDEHPEIINLLQERFPDIAINKFSEGLDAVNKIDSNKNSNENNQSNTTTPVANSEVAPVGEQVQQSEEVVSTPVQNKTIDQAINEPSVLYRDGQPGEIKVDGQTVVFETNDRVYELGNVNDVSKSDLSQFDIEAEKPLNINVAEDYSVDIEGTKYVNQNSDPMAAINYADNGDVVSINLETENGNKRTIRGQRAQEIAYQYTLRNFEENATEQQIDEAIAAADEAISTQVPIEQTIAPTGSTNIEEVQQTQPAAEAAAGVTPVEASEQIPAINATINEQTPSENTAQENEPGAVRQESVQEEQNTATEQPAEKRTKKKEPTLVESLKTKESRQSRAQELRDRISAYRNSGNNLGVANDPKREAQHWKDITDYAVIRIVDGAITTAENLAEELGIKLDSNVRKAFNDAKNDILNNTEEYGSNTVTAAKNLETARKREVYGFGERLRPDVVGFDAVSNEADRIMKSDPYSADRALNKAIEGEILNSVETVILTKYSQQLEDGIIEQNEILNDPASVEDVSRYNAVKAKRESDMDKLMSVYEALENTGTMAARALNIRKQTVIRDISLPGMLVQMRDAVGGRPLTEHETKEVSDKFMEMEKQRQAIQKRNEELETENARLNAEIEIARQKYEVDLQRRRTRTKQQTKTEAIADIKQRREEAKSALRDALGAIFSNQNVGFAMDPEQSARDQVKKDKALIKAVNGLIKTYIEEALVRFGKVEFDPIINKIHADVQSVVPNITKEQVMNLIDSSNTDTRPTKTELQKEIGLFNKQLRLMNEIDKLENGGIFRRRKKNDPVTNATIEGLQKKLDELRRFMEDPNDVAVRESARRDAQIESLTQQLRDLEEADVYTRKQRPESTPDPEIKNIRDEIARLKKEKADVNDKITDSKRSVQRRIDQLKKDIAEGNFQKERKQLVLDDPELNKMRKELDKLQFDFKVAAKKAEYKNRAWGFKVADALVEAVAIPRTLMATGDLSAPLRQLIYTLPSRPIMAAKAIGKMFQFWSSKSAYENWQEAMRDSELFGLAQKSGLSITGLVENVSASAKEEQFMSSFVDNVEKKIPILGSKGVKFNLGGKEFDFYLGANARAERGFTGAINKMRMDLFSRGAEILMNEGKTILTHPKEFKSLATYVNAVTGRGPMPKSMDGAMKYMSTVFFAPRLMSSRLWLLTGGPLYSATSPLVRKMYLRDTAAFIGFGLSVMAAATLAGMKTLGDDDDDWIGDTPVEKLKNLSTSVDFMNLKLGDRRYDVWGGFGQYVKFFIQEATGQRVTSTGNIKQLDGEGYNAMTRGDLVLRFGRSKLSPTMSLVTSALQGRNYMGEPFSLTKELANMSVPLVWQDTYEAWTELEEGPKSLATTFAPSFFGLGVQYWKSNKGMEFGSLPLEEKHKQLLAAKSVGTMAKDAEDIDIYDPETGGKRHPTGDEYKKYMDIWSDYIKSDLNENMEEYEKMSKQKFANRFNTIKSAATQFAKKELTGVSLFDTKLEYDGKTYMLTPDQVKQRVKDMDKYKKDNAAEYEKLREQYISQGMAPNEAKIKINKKIDSDARSYTKDEMVQKLMNNEIDLKEEN